jgi:hypothetical protein
VTLSGRFAENAHPVAIDEILENLLTRFAGIELLLDELTHLTREFGVGVADALSLADGTIELIGDLQRLW